jgi:hypothetical protein
MAEITDMYLYLFEVRVLQVKINHQLIIVVVVDHWIRVFGRRNPSDHIHFHSYFEL